MAKRQTSILDKVDRIRRDMPADGADVADGPDGSGACCLTGLMGQALAV